MPKRKSRVSSMLLFKNNWQSMHPVENHSDDDGCVDDMFARHCSAREPLSCSINPRNRPFRTFEGPNSTSRHLFQFLAVTVS